MVTAADLAAYEVVSRTPIRVSYRGREVLTNPPPSAGGILLAHALALLDGDPEPAHPPNIAEVVDAMERTQSERTPEFLDGLGDPEFVKRFLARRSPLGSTTHVVGARPRGLGVLGDVLERFVLGRRRAGHRSASEQHARRAGSQPARLSPPSARPPAAEHDVADRRAPRRSARAGGGQRRLEPDPLGDPADDHPRDRRRPARRATPSGRRESTSRTASSTSSPESTSRRLSAPAGRSPHSGS